MYKLHVSDRKYTTWKIFGAKTLEVVETSISPIKHKLFDQDIFDAKEDRVTIVHSCVRSMKNIPGVLVLEGDKTYGKRNRKFLYRCIPDDKRLPEFLIRYSKKMGFSKKNYNKYVIFKFLNWDNDYPIGTLIQVLGDVTKLDHFYEYQLYCKSLYASIQTFTKNTMKKLRTKSTEYFIDKIDEHMIDKTNKEVFSIDPHASKDFDDAFSFEESYDHFCIGIYIANVALWLDVMGIWESFSRRVATIYLPDRKRPMLPTVLSDLLCSLRERETRFAFTLELSVSKNTGEIIDSSFYNSKIRVRKNYTYDNVTKYDAFKKLFECVKKMNKYKKYVPYLKDSHDMVSYLMIVMNYISAKKLQEFKTGIFRSLVSKDSYKTPEHLPENIGRFLKSWNSMGGSYEPFAELKRHDMLELEAYVHITSPIRRLVDLLNIMELQDKLGIYKKSQAAKQFYDEWTAVESFGYINTTMRAIRKVQNDCSLLNVCQTMNDLHERKFEGFMFDRIERNDGLYQYMVYLPELKMVNRVTIRNDRKNMSFGKFKLYVFVDEHRLKQKLRLNICI